MKCDTGNKKISKQNIYMVSKKKDSIRCLSFYGKTLTKEPFIFFTKSTFSHFSVNHERSILKQNGVIWHHEEYCEVSQEVLI